MLFILVKLHRLDCLFLYIFYRNADSNRKVVLTSIKIHIHNNLSQICLVIGVAVVVSTLYLPSFIRFAFPYWIVSFIRCRTSFLNNFIIWYDGIYNCHISMLCCMCLCVCVVMCLVVLPLLHSVAHWMSTVHCTLAYLAVIMLENETYGSSE